MISYCLCSDTIVGFDKSAWYFLMLTSPQIRTHTNYETKNKNAMGFSRISKRRIGIGHRCLAR